ncbi:hypothetical protein PWT90_08762 [Aphanocladium album]|nr:hypothetical protein PWT90_08762 [Aphanocladium album]
MMSAAPTTQQSTQPAAAAGTVGPGGRPAVAPISLDYTMRQLFDQDSDGAPPPTFVHHPLPGGSPEASSSNKFTYHFKLPGSEAPTSHVSARLSGRVSSQRYCFSAGKMPVVILDPCQAHDAPSFAQLREDQRPNMTTISDLGHLRLDPGSRIVVTIPTDWLSHLPHAVDPETHYELSSKRGLARSGLPTPPSTVIDVLLQPNHRCDPGELWSEASRMLELLEMQRLPFVLKLNQSHSGMGTLAVHCEKDRAHAKAVMSDLLPAMLQQLNTANHHLHPCSLVLQDYLVGPAVSLSFFVTPRGRAVFVICSDQHFNSSGYWAGGSAVYSKQDVLRTTFSAVMEEATQFLHRRGYCGPAGIDIMTDDSGTHHIIDLNPRITASFHLGPLTGHFVRRGLDAVTVMKEVFSGSREVFEEAFDREIRDGQLVVTAWAHDEPSSLSHAVIVVGERNLAATASLVTRVKVYKLGVGML